MPCARLRAHVLAVSYARGHASFEPIPELCGTGILPVRSRAGSPCHTRYWDTFLAMPLLEPRMTPTSSGGSGGGRQQWTHRGS